MLSLEQIITIIVPSIMWFYYKFFIDDCESPVDDIMNIMTILYYVAVPLIIIACVLIICYKSAYVYIMLFFLPNTILTIVLIILAQIKYNKSWENNTCSNLKLLTKGWLIWNYIHNGLDGIFYIFGLFLTIFLCYVEAKEKQSFEYFMHVKAPKYFD